MDRRSFMGKSLAAGAVAWGAAQAAQGQSRRSNAAKFKLKYAPHFGMFKNSAGADELDQLKFIADQGFRALEDNRMNRKPVELQEKIAREMTRLGLEMGVFVATGSMKELTFVSSEKEAQDKILQDMRAAVEVAKRVNAKWCTIVLGHHDTRREWDYQTAQAIDTLRRCADICAPSGLVMVMEPLNWWKNHPGLFLSKVPQAYMLCRAVDHPSCKILFDMYHQQITEGNIIPNVDMAWDEVGYIQTGDNPGRKEPTTGEMNYRNIFKHLHEKGCEMVIGMEHGNSRKGVEGEQAVIDAYRACDDF